MIYADTKAPIPEALVIAYVTVGLKGGWGMHGPGWRNLQRTAMPTDASGRFSTPAWTWSKNRPIDMRAYLAGFTAYAPGYVLALPDDAIVVMQPIEWAHALGIVRTDDLKPSRPVRLYLRRIRRRRRPARAGPRSLAAAQPLAAQFLPRRLHRRRVPLRHRQDGGRAAGGLALPRCESPSVVARRRRRSAPQHRRHPGAGAAPTDATSKARDPSRRGEPVGVSLSLPSLIADPGQMPV